MPFPKLPEGRDAKGADYTQLPAAQNARGQEFGEVAQAPADPAARYLSPWFGTPMFFICRLGGLELPNTPLITVEASKLIVKTPVAGGDYAVTEIIGLDNYRVTMQGYALVEPGESGGGLTVPNEYPAEWARELNKLHRRKEALAAECELLGYFGITHLVIENFTWGTAEGAQGYAPWKMTCISDVPVELLLKEAGQEGGMT